MIFIKIDPTEFETSVSLAGLGLNPGDAFSVLLVGDFSAAVTGTFSADEHQNSSSVYNGGTTGLDGSTATVYEFSGTDTLTIRNDDVPLDDNSDPDGDYGVIIQRVPVVVEGTDGDDDLFGDSGNDLIRGFGGNDFLTGLGGDDTLRGGPGNDNLLAGEGDDVINPGDNVGGDTGFDFIDPGTGNDTINMGGITQGYVIINYSFLDGIDPITVNIDGSANTGSVDKGSSGSDVLNDVVNPLNSGWTTGGLLIRGTSGDDIFNVAPGFEQWMSVVGRGGNDTFNISGVGLVRLDYSDLSDPIMADLGNGTVQHGAFTDTITGNAWEIRGTDGADSLLGSAADESFIGRAGDDTIDGAGGFDRVRYDRAGNDSAIVADFTTGTVSGTFNGAAFTDSFSNIEHLRASRFDDTVTGDSAAQFIETRDGNDTVNAGKGDDTVLGEGGDDEISGQAGQDILDGGDGNDLLRGGQHSDSLSGGRGSDELFGQGGGDTLKGGAGNDRLNGGGGNDDANGGKGDDFLKGGTRNDLLQGGKGDDSLFGNSFDDTLEGGRGHDNLNAGGDDDLLIGGKGNDTHKGGGGNDIFVFADNNGKDIILDFEATNDSEKIDLSDVSAISDIGDLLGPDGAASQQGSDVLISTGGGHSIILRNVSLGDLDSSDFIF